MNNLYLGGGGGGVGTKKERQKDKRKKTLALPSNGLEPMTLQSQSINQPLQHLLIKNPFCTLIK